MTPTNAAAPHLTDPLDQGVHDLMRKTSERIIIPHFRKLGANEVIEKAADDFVTVADREAEVMLFEGLAKLLPDAALVGEESAYADPSLMDRLGDSLCWIVDPIDGTNNYTAGKTPFGILVALSQDGVAVSGWIYDVLTGRLCHAHRGRGAFVNGERMTARTTGEDPPVAGISMLFSDPAKRAAMQHAVAGNYTLVPIPRCAAEQYPHLALGVNDVAIFERTLPWDHAAGALFLNEAGGMVARHDGSPYRVDDNRKGLIGAASRALWEGLAERLAKAPAA